MLGGIWNAITGQTDFRAKPAQVNTQAGQLAIQQQTARAGQQARAGQASMAAQARGPSAALAMREAQRRGATATQDIGAAAAAQQNQMAQQAALANQQATMQAQQINAGIAQNNAAGLQKGIGVAAGAMGGALMMSDERQKEIMYSDFRDKETAPSDFDLDYIIRYGEAPAAPQRENPYPAMERDAQTMRELEALRVAKEAEINPPPVMADAPISRPAPARSMVTDPNGPLGYRPPPDAEGRAAFGLPPAGPPQPMRPSLSQAASERATIEGMRSPSAEYQPQQMREGTPPEALSDQAIAVHLRDRREAEQLQAMAAEDGIRLDDGMRRPNYSPPPRLLTDEQAPSAGGFGAALRDAGNQLASDKREKEIAFRKGAATGYAAASSALVSPVLVPAAATMAEKLADAVPRGPMKKARISSRTPEPAAAPVTVVPPPGYAASTLSAMTPGYAMPSDFRDKEISRENLDPVEPTVYKYTPESSMRQAVEHGMRGEDPARIYADRREPRLGIVAQDLQDSPLFDDAVVDDDPTQLAIDRDRATSLALAELGRVNERMSAIEDAISRRKKVA